ncbi:MAG: efflux RND transporter permease subunit [Deltaproteobacteria bacterium]
MILSDLSIQRPVLAWVISLLILLVGVAAYMSLPVRQYPDVTRPVVSVSTEYTGASPETVESTITNPLEDNLNSIDGIRSISSQSSFGTSAINIEFVSSRDVDAATQDVTNAVSKAIDLLPVSPNVSRPVVSKVSSSAQPIIWLVLQGKDYSIEQLSQIADLVVKRKVQVLPGVGNVIIGGEHKWAMRIWLDPAKLKAYNLAYDDVTAALALNNVQLPAGRLKSDTRFFNIVANGQMTDPKGYADLVIREVNGVPVRISDVGWVQLGSESYDLLARFNGKPVVGAGIVPLTKSNAIDISNAVHKLLPELRQALPQGVTLTVAVDHTEFIRSSLHEAISTLLIAFGLVILVVLVFLRTFWATLIPVLAVPISIVGAFAGMWVLGFSVNILTLFSLVLSIGLVIDDAIIMLENIYRHMEEGEKPIPAAIHGAREIAFPVLSTTISLIAIFIPLGFMRGDIGRLFSEFALTVPVAVGLSGLIALTMTPMLCSRALRLSRPGRGPLALFEHLFERLHRGYTRLAEWSVRHRWTMAMFMVLNVAAMVGLYSISPQTFVPVEDQGFILTIIKAPEGSNLWYTLHSLEKVEKEYFRIPSIDRFFAAIGIAVGGPASPRTGLVFAHMKPFDERTVSQMQVVKELFGRFQSIPGVLAFPINPPSLGEQATAQDVQFVVMGPKLDELAKFNQEMLDKVHSTPGMINVQSDLTINTPQVTADFERERAADLGISVQSLAGAMEVGLGGSHVSDFIMNNKSYKVLAQLEPKYRAQPEQIGDLYVRSASDTLVPLSYLVHVKNGYGPDTIYHYNLQRSFTINASLLPSLPLSTALDKMQQYAANILPKQYGTALTGKSRDFRETSGALYFTFGAGLIFIYLVLAAQFESWVHPVTILLSVPLALTGALATLRLTGHSLNLYSEIGIIMLIGLVTKNGILLVDYANRMRVRGHELAHAAVEAGRIRFRPIVMTSLTMIVGSLPLALATGAGAQSRQPLGWAVVGGLLFSTVFTLLITPVFYLLITSLAERLGLKTVPPSESWISDHLGKGEQP